MRLADIANRLTRLKANSKNDAGLLTYPIGAVFCAAEAQRCGFSDRHDHPDRWKEELNQALVAARDLAHGKRVSPSTWLSVVHFNSALHRIDVGYERLVKHLSGTRSCRFPALVTAARKEGFPPTAISLWDQVRTHEVNRLKHETGGALSGQRISFQDMLKSLDALVRLLETRL